MLGGERAIDAGFTLHMGWANAIHLNIKEKGVLKNPDDLACS